MSKLNFLSRFKPGTFPVDKVHPLIDAELDDEDDNVRIAAARNLNATKENLDKALSDIHGYVRAAANNPRYKEYYPNGHE